MKQKRFLGLFCLGVFAVALAGIPAGDLQGQVAASLRLPERNAFVGSPANFELTLNSNQEVQGLVAAVDWDATVAVGSNLAPATGAGQALMTADLIQPRIEASFFVLGVIMDTDGAGAEKILPGNNILIATLTLTGVPSGQDRSSPLTFKDGTYGTVDVVKLDNIIVVGGLSIGSAEGLGLVPGRVNVLPPPPGVYRIQDASSAPGATSQPVNVLLDVDQRVQGYVVAITHNPAEVTLTNITIAGTAAEANGADFNNVQIFPNGGTLGVVMDLLAPHLNNDLPPGVGLAIGRYTYSVVNPPQNIDCEAEPPQEGNPVVSNLAFSDFAIGDPPKENVIVVAGFSRNPELRNGTVTFNPPRCPVRVLQAFACGSMLLIDDDQNPDTPKVPGPIKASQDSKVQVCFWYRSPPTGPVDENNDPGSEAADPADLDDIQGLSMAITFGAGLEVLEPDTGDFFSLEGTITEAVGAEFVNVHFDNTKRELVIGILVDALPPFDGKTFPPTFDYLKVICVDFRVAANASCGEFIDVTFSQGGATGAGQVLVKNLISVMNMSFQPQLNDCQVEVVGIPTFIRGDCNFDAVLGMENMAVNIADAAAVVSTLFYTGAWKHKPKCNDACDANDDGRLDLADSVTILRYLFVPGNQNAIPKSDRPGCESAGPTNRGQDCTGDKLDCVEGTSCPIVIP